MSDHDPVTPVSAAEPSWQELDRLIERLAELATSPAPPEDFYAELLKQAVSAVGAVGGGVWTLATTGQLQLRCESGLQSSGLAGGEHDRHRLSELVLRVRRSGKPVVLPPGFHSGSDEGLDNPTSWTWVFSPWSLDEDHAGLLAVFFGSGLSPAAERGCLELFKALSELAADHERHRRVRALEHRTERLAQFERFLQQIHGSLDLATVASRIAHEGRRFIGCDRVSVAICRRGRCRVLAVSGVEHVHPRAESVRRMGELADRAAAGREAVWSDETSSLPPEVEQRLHDYLDVTHARDLGALPLVLPADANEPAAGDIVGVLIVENFHAPLDEGQRVRAAAAVSHSALAIGNAIEMNNVPGARLLRVAGQRLAARGLTRPMLALLALAGVVAALALVPADMAIKARGELQPRIQREVFAPADGTIKQIHVRHGEAVAAGKVLVEMRNAQLDFEEVRLRGELQTARKRLGAVQAERLQLARDASAPSQKHSALSTEEEELRELIAGLQKQEAVLERQQGELTIHSPLAGVVLTWDVEAILDSRPVGRGQSLMTVADVAGPWFVELRIPEHDAGRVAAALQVEPEGVAVSFVLATEPGATHQGVIRTMGARMEVGQNGEVFVPVEVLIEGCLPSAPTPGAAVVAKVHCGRRSVGYVWLHDAIDAVRVWWAF